MKHDPTLRGLKIVASKLERFTRKARAEPHRRFTSLMGLLFDPEGLRESFDARMDARRPESMG